MPRKIIIDTDPGQDDAVALLLALAHRGVVLNGDDEVPDDVEDRQLGRRPMRERELETGEEDL